MLPDFSALPSACWVSPAPKQEVRSSFLLRLCVHPHLCVVSQNCRLGFLSPLSLHIHFLGNLLFQRVWNSWNLTVQILSSYVTVFLSSEADGLEFHSSALLYVSRGIMDNLVNVFNPASSSANGTTISVIVVRIRDDAHKMPFAVPGT